MRLIALALVAVIAAACGGAGAGGPLAPASPTRTPVMVRVTRADDRGTVAARVGDRIQIALGTDYNWRLDPPDGVVLVHPIQNYMLVRGTQAIWTLAAPGTSTIRATGTVVCPSGQACIMIVLSFETTVVATGP